MFWALNGATLTPWRRSQRQSPGGDNTLARVRGRARDQERPLHRWAWIIGRGGAGRLGAAR